MNKNTYPIGSISSGTMRSQDLFDSFTSELSHLSKTHYTQFFCDHQDLCDLDYDEMTDEQEESLGYAVEELSDILGEFAGPYFYFGAHPDDGADYGFWFDEYSFFDAVYAGEILKVDELPDRFIVQKNQEYFAVMLPAGRLTLYNLDGEEIWSIV